MQVVVVRRASSAAEADASWRSVSAAVSAFGHELQPLHPSTRDPELQRYFAVEVADAKHGEDLVRALTSVPDVDSVYLKPADDVP